MKDPWFVRVRRLDGVVVYLGPARDRRNAAMKARMVWRAAGLDAEPVHELPEHAALLPLNTRSTKLAVGWNR